MTWTNEPNQWHSKNETPASGRATPGPGRIIHTSYPMPNGQATPCRPAIVTGLDGNVIFATQFAPSQAPVQITLDRSSNHWHWPELG